MLIDIIVFYFATQVNILRGKRKFIIYLLHVTGNKCNKCISLDNLINLIRCLPHSVQFIVCSTVLVVRSIDHYIWYGKIKT